MKNLLLSILGVASLAIFAVMPLEAGCGTCEAKDPAHSHEHDAKKECCSTGKECCKKEKEEKSEKVETKA
ncbi:MAG: hypothetical protein AAFY98_01720 [Verrucomicrobiota bacterium]